MLHTIEKEAFIEHLLLFQIIIIVIPLWSFLETLSTVNELYEV